MLRPSSLVACALSLLCAAAPARAEEIKIEVSRTQSKAGFSGDGLTATQGTQGEALVLARLAAHATAHTLAANEGQLLLDKKPVRAPLVVRPGPAALQVDGRALPGRLEVWAEQGKLVLVNALDLEEYVAAVVSSEVPAQWPAAALQAQSVAARTYAVAQKIQLGAGARAHLGSSVLDQVYKGAAHPQGTAKAAAEATFGEVLTFDSAPIEAWFSASCGGTSESAEAAFNTPAGSTPYAKSQGDGDADDGFRALSWTVRLPLWKVSFILKKAHRISGAVATLAVAEQTASGRAKSVRLGLAGGGGLTVSGVELRQLIGYTALPSLFFTVRAEGKTAVFTGRGSGHGVGLCQWGARGRAARGESYREILAHYYPGAEVRRMY